MADFDWVTARAGCSALPAWQELKAGLQEDVNKAKALPGGTDFKLVIYTNQFGVVKESRDGTRYGRSVGFNLRRSSIEVCLGEPDNLTLIAKATLDENGKPALCVDGKEIELWRLRMLALEDLFFLG